MTARALLDSNVLVAAVSEAHEHHRASLDLLERYFRGGLAVPAHSYAERLQHADARRRARSVRSRAGGPLARSRTHPRLYDSGRLDAGSSLRRGAYAAPGGVGPRLYDKLIGQTAVAYGIPAIVTWDFEHMPGLFPHLTVATPEAFGAA